MTAPLIVPERFTHAEAGAGAGPEPVTVKSQGDGSALMIVGLQTDEKASKVLDALTVYEPLIRPLKAYVPLAEEWTMPELALLNVSVAPATGVPPDMTVPVML